MKRQSWTLRGRRRTAAVIVGCTAAAAAAATGRVLAFPPGDIAAIRDGGTVLQIAIPAAGFILAYARGDRDGLRQNGYGLGLTLAVTWWVKLAVQRIRPDGGPLSFPSGHTAAAFAGAAFLYHRYGIRWGLPAYLLAAFVGASRIVSLRHWPSDVLAGAFVAIASLAVLTRRRESAAAASLKTS